MRSQKEIEEAKEKYFPVSKGGRSYEMANACSGFELGLEYADEHPCYDKLVEKADEWFANNFMECMGERVSYAGNSHTIGCMFEDFKNKVFGK